MPTRREILQLGLATGLGVALPGCVRLKDLQPECPIDWAPSLIAPVFHGFRDFATPGMRVYFPSLDGSPQNAELLVKCERYPLVIFIHGDCGGDPIRQWISLPQHLARSGYVVAVTQFGGVPATGDPALTAPLREVHDFMRNTWEFRDRLLPSPNTAVVGHSFGGTLAAQLAGEIPVAALASLSGAFGQAQNPIALLSGLRVPSLFLWNKVDDINLGAELDGGGMFASVTAPKHAVLFKTGAHGDYMSGDSPRCSRQSTCALVRPLATDFVTTFLSKYVRPEFAFTAFTFVPESLFVRPQDLPAPPENGFYAGSYLLGMQSSRLVSAQPNIPCSAEIRFATTVSTGTTFLRPA
jgi:pimeloyl-ACP methyl ester carboxylesterase